MWQTIESNSLKRIRNFFCSEDGPTSVEYAVLLAMLAAVMISAIIFVGDESNAVSEGVVNSLDQALNK